MAKLEAPSHTSTTWEQVAKIMGKKEFENFLFFFLSIFSLCDEYKKANKAFVVALITRRFHVLFEIFWRIACEEIFWAAIQAGYYGQSLIGLTRERLEDLYRHYFVTDNALLASADQLAKFYIQTKDLPELIIVDELLIHGRALNHFLLELEAKLADAALRQTGCPEEGEKIAAKVEEKLHLKIFARNKSVLLLLFRYAKEGRLDCFREYEVDRWKTLSLHFARVVSIAPVNNVAYAWSFALADAVPEKLPGQSPQAAFPFQRVQTGLRGYRQTTDLFVYPAKSNPKALFTVRCKKSLSSFSDGKRWLYVPYIMYDQLEWENVWDLHQRISGELLAYFGADDDQALRLFRGDSLFGAGGPSGPVAHSYYRWCVQANDLVLNGLLMRVWMEQSCGLSVLQRDKMIESINWEQVGRNYHCLVAGNGQEGCPPLQVENSVEALKRVWSFICGVQRPADLLSSYLDVLTKDAGSVLPAGWQAAGSRPEKENWKDQLECAVQQAIYTIGLDAEKNAYDRYGSGLVFSERTLANWGDHYSLQDIITRCIQEYGPDGAITDIEMDYLLALITQAMDLGHVGMEPICGERSWKADTEENVYTQVKAGEQSLFIAPFRYRNYLPVLSLIERRYQNSWEDQLLEIGRFVRRLKKAEKVSEADCENLYSELGDFVKGLYLSGQTVSAWNDVQLSEQVDKESYSAWEQTMQDSNERAAYLKIYQGY